MFLAWKEIWHSKGKFSLIAILVVLVSYLVYFLSSLAYGLASSYTNGIDAWQADSIVLTSDANDNAMMSYIDSESFLSVSIDGQKAGIGLSPSVGKDGNGGKKTNLYVFGLADGAFLAPQGFADLSDSYHVVADSGLRKEGYAIGDTLSLVGFDHPLILASFVEKATFQTASIIYMPLSTYRAFRFGSENSPLVNAIVVKGSVLSSPGTLKTYSLSEFKNTLPGYQAQVTTFSLMIGFLIAICSFVLGVFLYVLTLQKTSMFGVMKAQGVPNYYLAFSVVGQTLILTISGIVLGLALALISGIALEGKIPFAINWLFYLGISLAFLVFSLLGSLFSLRAVLRIDPLKAIG